MWKEPCRHLSATLFTSNWSSIRNIRVTFLGKIGLSFGNMFLCWKLRQEWGKPGISLKTADFGKNCRFGWKPWFSEKNWCVLLQSSLWNENYLLVSPLLSQKPWFMSKICSFSCLKTTDFGKNRGFWHAWGLGVPSSKVFQTKDQKELTVYFV